MAWSLALEGDAAAMEAGVTLSSVLILLRYHFKMKTAVSPYFGPDSADLKDGSD